MDFYRFAGTAFVVCIIGPLFWLLVGIINNKIGLAINRRVNSGDGEQSSAQRRLLKYLARIWAVGQKPIS